MINRYSPSDDMERDNSGDYVHYLEYASEVSILEDIIEDLKQAKSELREQIYDLQEELREKDKELAEWIMEDKVRSE